MPRHMWRNPRTFELPCPAFKMFFIFSQRLIKWDLRECCCSSLSCVWLFAIPRIAAHQAPLSVGFPRQQYSSGLPFFPAGLLPDPGIEPVPSVFLGRFFTTEQAGKTLRKCYLQRKEGQVIKILCEIMSDWILSYNCSVQFSSVQSLSHVWLFVTPWIAAGQDFLSITNSQSSLRLTSIESVMPSSHLILCHPRLLLPPIPPSIRVFSSESNNLELLISLGK